MKNSFLIAFLFVFSAVLHAQSGSMYVGGSVGFNKYGGDAKGSSYNLSPEVGTWLSNDLQVGGVLVLRGNSDDSGINPKSNMGLIAYGRKWKSVGDKFSVYYGVMVDFGSSKTQTDVKTSTFGLHADAGFAYSLAERWGIAGRAATLGFAKNGDNNVIGLNAANAPVFNLGIYYTFKQ